MHNLIHRSGPEHRWLLGLGSLAGFAVLVTAALSVAAIDAYVIMSPGPGHDYDLQVASSAAESWTPSAEDWAQGNPVPITPRGGDDDLGNQGPDSVYSVAVRNSGTALHSSLCAEIFPRSDSRSPGWGTTRIILRNDDETLVDDVLGDRMLLTGCTSESLRPGEVRQYSLAIIMAPQSGITESEISTVRLRFTGASR